MVITDFNLLHYKGRDKTTYKQTKNTDAHQFSSAYKHGHLFLNIFLFHLFLKNFSETDGLV